MQASMIQKARLGRNEAISRRLNLAEASHADTGAEMLRKARQGRLDALYARHGGKIILFRQPNRLPQLSLSASMRVVPFGKTSVAARDIGYPQLVQ
ncbi:MAG: hypothetical protein KF887_11650 [Paracoccaceae bacterium]|nr:MAG: hypothetical protein KF887_11650 [Paracoccaceae bacterium]